MSAPNRHAERSVTGSNASMFMTFAIIVVVTNLILSSTMYANYKRHSMELVQSYSVEELSQVSYSMSFMFEAAKLTLQQLYTNPSVFKLMNADRLGELETASLLSQVGVPSGGFNLNFVSSIYIYNQKADKVYTDGKAFTFSQFPDRDIIERLESGEGLSSMKPIARKVQLSARDKELYGSLEPFQTPDVYTFVLFDSYSRHIDSAIMLNVSQEWMKQTIEAMNPEMSGETMIIDDQGRIALGNDRFLYLEQAKRYIDGAIPDGEGSSGYAIEMLDGRKQVVSYVSSEMGWTFIRLTPYEVISGKLSRMLMLTWIISVLVGILAVLAVMFSSRILLRLMNKRTNALLGRYEREKRSGYEQKQRFLRTFATSRMTEYSLTKGFERFSIDFDTNRRLFTVAFKIDRYEEFCDKYGQDDRMLLDYGVINIIEETVKSAWKPIAFVLEDGVFGALFLIDSEENEAFTVRVEELVRQIGANVAQYLAISLSVSIGDPLDGVAEVPESFAEHLETLGYKLFAGPGAILYASRIREIKKREYSIPDRGIAALIDEIRRGDREGAHSSSLALLRTVDGHAMTYLFTLLLQLAIALRDFMKRNDIADDGSIYLRFIDVAKGAPHNETLEEIAARLDEPIADIMERLASKQEQLRSHDRYNDMLRQVEELIEAELTNPNLSPDLIAERMGLSAKYLRALYKRTSGESLAESINLSRMSRAKGLLADTELSVQEVALRSGFINISYFYTLFKKYQGVTPNEYRLLPQSD
ncbi:AraC family transcriptional regulator [Cohnella fermenti]|uniref:AraC family transcriptional regulator n=1 Tax=Cohnella fermenti TaxID=2565925 RepID=A0A4S4C0W0_9BACL|nr:AraC family transcriptional regulator [Cohnella fermenti]THF79125.1 AraC family transcriptional regulator [Cohnella fermenti]